MKCITGEACSAVQTTVYHSEVPRHALPRALLRTPVPAGARGELVPLLQIVSVQEPLTSWNDVGWLYKVGCYPPGTEGGPLKISLRTGGCTVFELRFLRSKHTIVFRLLTAIDFNGAEVPVWIWAHISSPSCSPLPRCP